jgi:hypothetical protein
MNFSDFTDGDNTKRFDYDSNGNVIYAGSAAPGTASSAAAWSIKRYTYVGGNVTVIEWAGGDNRMASIWDNRAGLSYA